MKLLGTVITVINPRWKLSKTYRFHKKNAVDIDVDVICFTKKKKEL